MRVVVLVALASLALAGCPSPDAAPEEYSPGGPKSACAVASDCVLAGASCCACPSVAVPADDPGVAACDDVTCPVSTQCPNNVAPTCDHGTCALACAPLTCPNLCTNGYAADSSGCLTCTCAVADGCTLDSDCHETAADCCGCEFGGSDTAVIDVNAYQASLNCPSPPSCPGIDTCDSSSVVTCIAARCFLLPSADQAVPPYACGRPDLHPDPEIPAPPTARWTTAPPWLRSA